jgi:hypothetical protein
MDPFAKHRRASARAAVAAALLLLLAHALPAAAYVRSRIAGRHSPSRWAQPALELQLDVDSLPPGLSRDETLAAIRAAARTWSSRPCSTVSIRVDSGHRLEGTRRDGVHAIVFQRRWWCKAGTNRPGNCFDHRVAAMTTTHVGEAPLAQSGDTEIEEVDIELNAVDFAWRVGPPVTTNTTPTLDVQSVVTHELGHALGFSHVCGRLRVGSLPRCSDLPSEQRNSVMMPGADQPFTGELPALHSLSEDDEAAVCEVYPKPARASWGWALGGALLGLIGIAFAVQRVRARHRSRPGPG